MPTQPSLFGPFVSVIVPTYRREQELCATLKDLLEQDYDGYEVIVIDQTRRHESDTIAFLESLPEKVRVIRRTEANLPAARNTGIRQANGDIIILVDDDVRMESGFVQAHVQNYAHAEVMAVAGSVLDVQKRWRTELPPDVHDPYVGRFSACWQYDQRIPIDHAPGGNMSFRRNVAEKAGWFDENFIGPAFREESDFFIRVTNAGLKTIYDPEAWLIHARGFREGGCWTGFDGGPSWERYFNHAYFVFKNFSKKQWLRLLMRAVRGELCRKWVFRHPLSGLCAIGRFVRGWCVAWRRAPRLGLIG